MRGSSGAWARLGAAALAAALAGGAACKQIDLSDQPRGETLDRSRYFEDERSARTPVAGTIARGDLREDAHFYEGLEEGEAAESFPFELEREDLERGRERYEAFCAPCHGYVGEGDGMIVQRGFPRPPSFHSEKLRDAPPGHFYRVIARGTGAMPRYAIQVAPEDRWRIVGYVRALQRSQFARRADVPEDVWAQLEGGDAGGE